MTASVSPATQHADVTRFEVEEFLYREAQILDDWKLDDWLSLFATDAVYEVPTTDWRGWDERGGGFFILDNYDLIQARVKRLKSRKAHAENPKSRVHRMIGNVAVGERTGNLVEIKASFVIHRFRDETTQCYVGYYRHLLEITESGLLFRRRRSVLSHELLTPGARLSFII